MLKLSSLLSFILLLPLSSIAQECHLSISGYVKDKNSGTPVSYANIYLKETQAGRISDSSGFFRFNSLCAGKYHITISYVGSKTRELYLSLSRDTTLNIDLDQDSHLLSELAVTGQGGKAHTQESEHLDKENISENTEKNLGTMLENIAGVTIIKNGSGISKPVVHGLYGNRLTILNNGVAQSGQQWGVDHSPEIDPLVANRISVIKGVGALEYQGNSLGSVILVEPESINKDPHVHGKARYFFSSNGLGNGLNLELQRYSDKIAWRIIGTAKKFGDANTPDYYLTNTGREEGNLALQVEKSFSKNWSSDLYFSSFNTKLGILRGAQVGNLTDLQEALGRKEPFYTRDKFSYDIAAPHQKVNHHLLKLHTKYQKDSITSIDFSYAGQLDNRREYDVRRGGRSDKPSLSLEQYSHFLEAKYQKYFKTNWRLNSGVQFSRIANTNIPETGILPLIPDYITYKYGLFGILTRSFSKTTYQIGGRYDFEDRRVAAISFSVPRRIIRYAKTYHNYSALAGFNHSFSKKLELAYNIGYASRNPEVNELYSNGLHQGVSGIEEGDPNLKTENSLKTTLSLQGHVNRDLFFGALGYFQNIQNYIYLNPQNELRLTIRGAFPLFRYEQTNAHIYGLDFFSTYEFNSRLHLTVKYSYIKGNDLKNNVPLVYMPSNNIFGEVNYHFRKIGKFEKVELQLNNKFVFKQKNLLPSQDFVAPPAAYNLVGLKITAERQLKKTRLNLYLKVDNLLNQAYRDYLNRQRYFADDQGINLTIGINLAF